MWKESQPADLKLYEAIGGVAFACAELDDYLRFLLSEIIRSEAIMSFVHGQTTDWLRQALMATLKENEQTQRYPAKEVGVLIDKLGSIQQYHQYRAWIIHGVFLTERDVSDSEVARAKDRPFGDEDDGTPVMFCLRSRFQRSQVEVRKFSLGDVRRLADEIDKVLWAISEAWRWMKEFEKRGPRKLP